MEHETLLILALILSLSMLLGFSIFFLPPVVGLYCAVLALALPVAIYKLFRGIHPPLLIPIGLLAAAGVISAVVNPGPHAWGVLIVWAGGLCMMVLAADLGRERVLAALWLACWIWIIYGPFIHVWVSHNRNYDAIWPAIGLVLAFARGRPVLGLPFAIALLWLGSRGALLGAAAGVLIWYAPVMSPKQLIAPVLILPVAVAGLAAIRPRNAMDRIYFVQRVISDIGNHPWFGSGPGGIYANRIIPDLRHPTYSAHAHNLFANILGEMGLVGVLSMVLGAAWLWWAKPVGRWQLAVLGAVLAHSLVDMPLYWPGGVLVVAAVAGVVEVRKWQAAALTMA